MNIPLNAATLGLAIVLLTNLVVLISGYTNLKRDAKANKEATIALAAQVSALSNRYDNHVGNSGIHQESMSREAITLHFSAATAQMSNLVQSFKQHSEEDMEVFKGIRQDLKEIRTLTERRA